MHVPLSLLACAVFVLLAQSGLIHLYSRRAMRLKRALRDLESGLAAEAESMVDPSEKAGLLKARAIVCDTLDYEERQP